jgi:transposase
VIFVGVDWAEAHHDLVVMDAEGAVLARARVPEGIVGVARLHALVGEHADDPGEVVVGIELDRGLLVAALVAAGYEVHAINPLASARYRERYAVSGAKSDAGDAKVLADLVRTDRHNHRPVAGDSELGEALKVLARAHQSAIWSRQRQLNLLRSALREYYPAALAAFGTDLGSTDALAVRGIARRRSSAGACRSPRSPRRCTEAAGSATSTPAPPRSRPPCGPSTSRRRRRWPPRSGRYAPPRSP